MARFQTFFRAFLGVRCDGFMKTCVFSVTNQMETQNQARSDHVFPEFGIDYVFFL